MKKAILIVEDDVLLADVYKRALVKDGFKVLLAHDYDSANKLFNPKKISIVLLDILLGDKNGFEVLKSLRKKNGGKDVPIVIITGMNTQELDMDRELMVSLNIIGIHTKSQFSIKQLSSLISNYLSHYEAK